MSFRSTVITALVAAAVVPTVAAEARVDPPAYQDLRGADARPSPGRTQDLRSPDARDASRAAVATPAPPTRLREPARAAEHPDRAFPWLQAALIATLVGGAAGVAGRRFRPATGG
jgi:hypothetical protein